MFIHHVFFWLKNPGSAQDKADLKKGLETLLAIKPKISAHIGVPASTNRPVIDTTYTFSLLLIFNSLEDQEKYQVHPIHKKFVADCASLWERVVIYDTI